MRLMGMLPATHFWVPTHRLRTAVLSAFCFIKSDVLRLSLLHIWVLLSGLILQDLILRASTMCCETATQGVVTFCNQVLLYTGCP
jgi:hypothetical protein